MALDLPSAADENLLVHFSWAQGRTPGMRLAAGDDVTLVDSGLPCDTFNAAIRTRMSPDAAPERIQESINWFARMKRPFSWWVGPADTPGHLDKLLVDAGLEWYQTDPAMAADLSRLASVDIAPGGLEIRRVTTTEELLAFAHINAAHWSPPERFVIRYYVLAAEALLAPESPIWLYNGYLDGRAVATSEMTIGGGVVGLYNVSTDPDYRRRGIGSAITMKPLLDARDAGFTTAILQAEPDGIGVYRRLGFEVFGEVTEFKPAA